MLVKQVKGLELKESNAGQRLLLNNGCLWRACFVIDAFVSLFSSQMCKETDLESRLDPDFRTQVKRKWDVFCSATDVGTSAYAAYVAKVSKKGLAKTQRRKHRC